MPNQNRANLIKEGVYYTLGILLICGFVYLYWDAAGFLWMDKNSQIRRTGHQWDIQIHPASTIYGNFSNYHRLAVSLDKPNNPNNVSDLTYSLLQTCKEGRKTCSERIWRCVFKI